MMSWRKRSFDILRAQPQSWLRLSEVFSEVEQDIPAHTALRHGNRTGVSFEELSLNTARWRFFLSHVGPLVERRACNDEHLTFRAKRTDYVRIRPHDLACEACGGPRYLSVYPERGVKRRYNCIDCNQVRHVEVEKPDTKVEEVVEAPAYIAPQEQPAQLDVIHLNKLSSIKEVWSEYYKYILAAENPKLQQKARKIFEAALLDEHRRISLFRIKEYEDLGAPDLQKMHYMFSGRARGWMAYNCNENQKRRWGDVLIQTYIWGAMSVIIFFETGRAELLDKEIQIIIDKLMPKPPKPQQKARFRWLAPMRNSMSRWRIF